jgi:hypothetical protein
MTPIQALPPTCLHTGPGGPTVSEQSLFTLSSQMGTGSSVDTVLASRDHTGEKLIDARIPYHASLESPAELKSKKNAINPLKSHREFRFPLPTHWLLTGYYTLPQLSRWLPPVSRLQTRFRTLPTTRGAELTQVTGFHT